MHSKGVIHRYVAEHKLTLLTDASFSDLKPENLLLDDDYRIKIADFGTGKVLESGSKGPHDSRRQPSL